MKDTKTTNVLLLILVIPMVFYILKIMSFIFIPLVSSMFIALLFLPLMRWLTKHKVHNFISILIVLLIFVGVFKIGGELIKVTSKEILATDGQFLNKAQLKLNSLVLSVEEFFGVKYFDNGNILNHLLNKETISKNFGTTIDFIGNAVSMTLMTAFFVILWLAESINFQKFLNNTLLKQKYASVKTFMKIEKDLIKFVKVKFFVSALTGIGFGVVCYFFDISFPIFWGLFSFLINFVQMIGSVISVLLLSLFAFVELDPTSTLLFFIITITAVQIVFGGVLEPIFMGKSFSINIITILVMLMLWGYIWGVPGLIMSIPITVFLKIIFEQFSQTKILATLISGKNKKISIPVSKNSF